MEFTIVGAISSSLLQKTRNKLRYYKPNCSSLKLDFVHLSGITDSVNQALKKSGGDFNHLVFLVDH